jgi:hypothetical protein
MFSTKITISSGQHSQEAGNQKKTAHKEEVAHTTHNVAGQTLAWLLPFTTLLPNNVAQTDPTPNNVNIIETKTLKKEKK